MIYVKTIAMTKIALGFRGKTPKLTASCEKAKEVPFQQERLQKTTSTDGKKEKKSLHMYTRPGHLWYKSLKLINKEQTSLNICLKEEMIQW